MTDSIATGETPDVSFAGTTIDTYELSIDYNREIEEVPEEYDIEYFPDVYGGVFVPVPVNKPQKKQIVVDESVHGDITAAAPLPAEAKNQQPADLVIHRSPEVVIKDVVFQDIEFGGETWRGSFVGEPPNTRPSRNQDSHTADNHSAE